MKQQLKWTISFFFFPTIDYAQIYFLFFNLKSEFNEQYNLFPTTNLKNPARHSTTIENIHKRRKIRKRVTRKNKKESGCQNTKSWYKVINLHREERHYINNRDLITQYRAVMIFLQLGKMKSWSLFDDIKLDI